MYRIFFYIAAPFARKMHERVKICGKASTSPYPLPPPVREGWPALPENCTYFRHGMTQKLDSMRVLKDTHHDTKPSYTSILFNPHVNQIK